MKNAFYLLAGKNQLNQFKPLHVVQFISETKLTMSETDEKKKK